LWIRVLDEGDQLDEERKQWHAQATKSIGNKATRSLSRGRSKSLNHKDSRRHRKDPSFGMGNIDFLTARTLLGSQGVAPTIIVRPPGSQETRTQSGSGTMSSKCHSHSTSHATQSSQGAHRRNDSWGQHALKLAKYTASGALCGIQDQSQTSPMDEKGMAIEGAIKATDTKVIQLRRQHDSLEKEDFIVIEKPDFAAPVPDATEEDLAMGPGYNKGASPTPSGTTGRGVGIALSTPPPSDDHSQETYESMNIPDHPYAQGARYSYHPHQPTALDFSHERIARGSDFAGPHPSSPEMRPLDFNVRTNEMSMRHRFPPQANLPSLPHMAHPYAMGSYPAELHTNPEGLVDLDEDEPRDTNFEFGASSERLEHAYARMSTGNQDPLEVGEALTSFRRQGNRDTVFGLGEQAMEKSQATTEPAETRRTSINSQTTPLRIRRKPVSYADYEDISPASPEAEASTPSSEHLNAPKYRREASSSTVGHSSGSSPQHSPRPLGNVDDLEHFHDLFYKPDQSNPEASATSSLVSHAAPSDASHEIFSVEVGSSRSLRSGLSKLARKLTEEYEGTLAQEVPSDVDAFALAKGQRRGSLRGQRVPDIIADREFIFSDPSKPRRFSSPEPMDSGLPLRLNNEETGPDDDVPEDVESSRASSILERSSIEDDTFGDF
jgi:serine/arginine repetitive matrix protein 2